VRVWWLCALLLVAAIVGRCLWEWWEWRSETQLVQFGQLVPDAIIVGPETTSTAHQPVEPMRLLHVKFKLNSKTYDVQGYLPPRDPWYMTGSTIPIHIDPNNPERWTAFNADTLEPLYSRFSVALLLAPLVVVFALVALVRRRAVLRLWRDGEALEAVVVAARQASSAPLSRLLRCSPKQYGRDKILYTVIFPSRLAPPKPGESLWLIVLPGESTRALAARLYQ
jgi:hypothetical protein